MLSNGVCDDRVSELVPMPVRFEIKMRSMLSPVRREDRMEIDEADAMLFGGCRHDPVEPQCWAFLVGIDRLPVAIHDKQ